MSDNAEILNLANSTGFLFQIGVRHQIRLTTNEHGWGVIGQEHRWHHPITKQTGFADLVLANQSSRFHIIIECKRATGRQWVFLTPSDSTRTTGTTSTFSFHAPNHSEERGGWLDFSLQPTSPESMFCVVMGQDERNTPMLEHVADSLLPSTEAIAREDAVLEGTTDPQAWSLFIPLLVTNARLFTCGFDPGTIDLAQGKLHKADFKEVGLVRFRKGLATNYPGKLTPKTLLEANEYAERTMLIVNASALTEFLVEFHPHPNFGFVLRDFIEARLRLNC